MTHPDGAIAASAPSRLFGHLMRRGLLVYALLLAILVAAQVLIPGFLEPRNLGSLLKLAAFVGVAAIGQTFVILIGGIDMSIANGVTLANIVAAQLMAGDDANIVPAVAAITVIGAAVGAANATGVNYLRIPPMIMTLGVGTILRGVLLLYSKGAPKGNAAPLVRSVVNDTSIFGVAAPIVAVWLVLSLAAIVVLKYTVFGRKVYAVGSNARAARFSGINGGMVAYACYMVSGVTAALTGLLLAGYTGTASAESGSAYSMNTIVAVVIGGTSILGGRGGYFNTIAGTIILVAINSILIVVNIHESGRMFIQGAIILAMVLVYGRSQEIS